MNREVSNSDDVIDSRDIIKRIQELQEEKDDLTTAILDAEALDWSEDKEQVLADTRTCLIDWIEENGGAELKSLLALQEEAEGYSEDWIHGSTLIRDSYFKEYAQELCEDIGDVPKDLPSYIEIDWEATARNIQADYTEVDFDGVTYWIR